MGDESTQPTLTAYRIHPYPSMPIVPAPALREWMNRTKDRFAYRCLPLLIANQSGWFIINTHRIRVVWNGGDLETDLKVICKSGPRGTLCPAVSHFGHGVLTFNLNYLFRTTKGYNLWARGPANLPKDGIAPLEGIIETDWSVATFTMNWKVTTVNLPIDFEPGEPICMILPIKRGEVESFHPRVRALTSDEQLTKAYEDWSKSRTKFLRDLPDPASDAAAEKWQKDYVQGVGPGGAASPDHQVKLTVREFDLPPVSPSPSGRASG